MSLLSLIAALLPEQLHLLALPKYLYGWLRGHVHFTVPAQRGLRTFPRKAQSNFCIWIMK
jgi:hypothetical protein